LLRRILALVTEQRPSRRYRGHVRIQVAAFRHACLILLGREAERTGWKGLYRQEFESMTAMLAGSAPSAADRLTTGILGRQGLATDPMRIEAAAFNQAAERYYREELRRTHLADGLQALIETGRPLDHCQDTEVNRLRRRLLGHAPASLFLREAGSRMLAGEAGDREILLLILLSLLILHLEWQSAGQANG
jgi:hypothetical protein